MESENITQLGILGKGNKAVSNKLAEIQKTKHPWSVYYIGYFHLFVYMSIFGICYSKSLDKEGTLLWTIPLGWSIYCLWMIGHEGYHHTMAPSAYKRLNNFIGYMTMDCTVNSKQTWILKHHLIHHPFPWRIEPPPKDRQRLFGPNALVETLNIIYTVLEYWILDIQDLYRKFSLWKLLALMIRFLYLFSLPLNTLVATVFSLGIMTNYNALLTHAVPCQQSTKDVIVRQCRTSLDLFPDSQWCVFVTGALNCHSVHHVLPALPRALHPQVAKLMKEIMPGEYRYVDTWQELGALWILRHQNFEGVIKISDLPKLSKQSGNMTKQLMMDFLSFGFMAAICYHIPAYTLLFRN